MGTDIILKVLSDCGLTETESKVYLFLAKSGVQKVRDVSTNLKMHKAQVYRVLKDLEARGMVEKTFESPMRFTALPFEELLNLCIETKRNEANALETEKDRLATVWKASEIENPLIETFVVIEGRNNLYARIRNMLNRARKEFFVLTTGLGVIRGDLAGLLDAGITKARKDKDIHGKILTPITKQNFDNKPIYRKSC
jgi:sugar-specific transcriptional regulator TrmB